MQWLCYEISLWPAHLSALDAWSRKMTRLAIKRVYDPPGADDGTRILVDRLWPRGIAKEKASIDLWLRDIAPSHDLRKKFHGHPDSWDEFCADYFVELEGNAARSAAEELFAKLRRGPVTLLYAARDVAKNNAAALKLWLERRKNKWRRH